MRYCKRCVLPDTKPGIVIDEYGICNVCRHVEAKKTIDWKPEISVKQMLFDLLEHWRNEIKTNRIPLNR